MKDLTHRKHHMIGAVVFSAVVCALISTSAPAQTLSANVTGSMADVLEGDPGWFDVDLKNDSITPAMITGVTFTKKLISGDSDDNITAIVQTGLDFSNRPLS